MKRSRVFCTLSLLLSLQAFTAEASTVVPLKVDGKFKASNMLYAKVTVCLPGKAVCQTIDHIQVDTGSVGLRVFKQALSLKFPKTEKQTALCGAFGSGMRLWGPVQTVDVVLAGERSARVPIQIVDSQFASRPDVCEFPADSPNDAGANGVLGIAPGPGASVGYYSCIGAECSSSLPTPLLANPIHSNGVVIALQPIPDAGAEEASGTLTLGFDELPKGAVSFAPVDLKIAVGGASFPAIIDTGTTANLLPDNLGVSKCADPHYYCAPSVVNAQATLMNDQVMIPIGNYHALVHSGKYALPDTVAVSSSTVILGVPFLYGKSLHISYAGKLEAISLSAQ